MKSKTGRNQTALTALQLAGEERIVEHVSVEATAAETAPKVSDRSETVNDQASHNVGVMCTVQVPATFEGTRCDTGSTAAEIDGSISDDEHSLCCDLVSQVYYSFQVGSTVN